MSKPFYLLKEKYRLIILFSLLIITIIFTGFKRNENKIINHKANVVFDFDYLNTYKLMISDLQPYLNGPALDKRLVLQFSYKQKANPIMDIAWYKSNGMESNGANASKHYLERIPSEIGLNLANQTEYIFGNNYITIRNIKRYIRALPPDFDLAYLKFFPKVNSSSRHIYFEIIAYNTTNNAFDMLPIWLLSTTESTNPSPPKDPSY